MTIVNHLKGQETQNLFLTQAYGKHVVTGHLCKSDVTGASPTHVIKLQQLLGRGPWDGCEGLWYKGLEIKPADYKFYPGIQSTGMGDTTQGQDAVFNTDVPHSSVAWIRPTLAAGVGDFDTSKSPPNGLTGIFRTTKCQDYNSSGAATGSPVYSINAALQVADLILRIGGRPISRIDWGAWTDWRDFLGSTISHNYTALPNFDGFGLSVKFYNGTAFNTATLVIDRIDPVIEFVSSAGSPGIGVDVDNFLGLYEGYIKPKYTETYTFSVTHTHGARLWVNGLVTPLIDQWGTTGTHTATIALTAGQLYDIKLEWQHTTGNAELRLQWQSTSQALEVINHRVLYPKTVDRARYETHPFFSGPTRLDDAVRTVLNLCNSTYQEVNGKLRFFCLEQLTTPSFHFTDYNTMSVKLIPRDVTGLRNSWQATFRNTDSQYLEKDLDPIIIERDALIAAAGRKIDGEAVDLVNTNRHQGYRTLDNLIKRAVDSKKFDVLGDADTFPVLAGDRVDLDVEFLQRISVPCRVLESNDASSEETADERRFIMQEIV